MLFDMLIHALVDAIDVHIGTRNKRAAVYGAIIGACVGIAIALTYGAFVKVPSILAICLIAGLICTWIGAVIGALVPSHPSRAKHQKHPTELKDR